MIYTNTGRLDLAAQELNQALALNSEDSEAYAAMADLLRKQGRTAEVEPALQKAIDFDSSDWRWRNKLGAFYLSVGKLDAALREFNETVKLTPDNARAYNNLGVAYLRHEQFAEARTAFEAAVRLESYESHFSNLGAVLQLQGDYQGAAAMYRKAIDLNPSDYLGWGNLASVYSWNSADRARAPETYLKAIELAEKTRRDRPNDALLLAQLGSYYAAIRKPDLSLPLLRSAIALAPDDPTVVYFTGEAYELLGRREDALTYVRKAIALGYSLEYIRRNPELAGLRSDRRLSLDLSSKVR
jgi:serine/threonine-protein kinase